MTAIQAQHSPGAPTPTLPTLPSKSLPPDATTHDNPLAHRSAPAAAAAADAANAHLSPSSTHLSHIRVAPNGAPSSRSGGGGGGGRSGLKPWQSESQVAFGGADTHDELRPDNSTDLDDLLADMQMQVRYQCKRLVHGRACVMWNHVACDVLSHIASVRRAKLLGAPLTSRCGGSSLMLV